MESIRLEGITKSFGEVQAVKNLNLNIEPGQFVTLLGPSGCGKTTTLRCIAGLEKSDEGRIYIGDRLVFSAKEEINIPSRRRNLSMVFQTYAVWPHMSVFENVAFGLKARKLPKRKIIERVSAILEVVGIHELKNRFPHELSGGQQQRVALARALVVEPSVLLMDEPLSNLDARLRMLMRSELKRIHFLVGTTIVYVTHDQLEALSLSDQVVVMQEGVVQQISDPITLYDSPANLFVANFVGNLPINLIEGTVQRVSTGSMSMALNKGALELKLPVVEGVQQGDRLIVGIRPVDITPEKIEDSKSFQELEHVFQVTTVLTTGSSFVIRAERESLELTIQEDKDKISYLRYGDKILVHFTTHRIKLYAPDSGQLIG